MKNAGGTADPEPAVPSRRHDIGDRTKKFALRIVRLYDALPERGSAQIIGKQILRSGTSVGAHVAESTFAKSRADFTSKIDGAMQELQETRYWLDILAESGIVTPARLRGLKAESAELMSIFVAMVKKTRHT